MMVMGYNKVLDPTLCGGSVPGLVPEIYISFRFFMKHSSSMLVFIIVGFKTGAWYLGGNMKALFSSIMMILTRNKTIYYNIISPTTIYCVIGGKSKFKMLNSNNSWHRKL